MSQRFGTILVYSATDDTYLDGDLRFSKSKPLVLHQGSFNVISNVARIKGNLNNGEPRELNIDMHRIIVEVR